MSNVKHVDMAKMEEWEKRWGDEYRAAVDAPHHNKRIITEEEANFIRYHKAKGAERIAEGLKPLSRRAVHGLAEKAGITNASPDTFNNWWQEID